MQLREWNARLHGLVVFRALLGDPVVTKLAALTDRLEAADDSIAPLCDAVAAFEAALFAHTTNLGDYLSNAVLETETFCVRQAAAGQLSPVMEAALNSELNFLQKLCGLTLDALLEAADRQSRELAFLPRWETRQLDLTAAYNQRMREAGKKGYGMFAKHHVFTVENGQLERVAAIVSRCSSNVVSVLHDGSDPNMPISSCFLKLALETRDHAQIEQIRQELTKEGFQLVAERV